MTDDGCEGLLHLLGTVFNAFHGQGKRPVAGVGMGSGLDRATLTWVEMRNVFGDNNAFPVMARLACTPGNCRDMYEDPMMGSGGLPEGRLGEVSPRMEAGEPLEGRSDSNKEVSMSHGHSGQDLDYPACWPILAWST